MSLPFEDTKIHLCKGDWRGNSNKDSLKTKEEYLSE